MKTFKQLVEEYSQRINELMPWDAVEKMQQHTVLVVDVREPDEYRTMHIPDSINVPRGILETACEYDYDETVPELVTARDKPILVVCRSGNRSVFVTDIMQQMGYRQVWSLKTGLRGWNDYEQPLVDDRGNTVDIEAADQYFASRLRPEQKSPKK